MSLLPDCRARDSLARLDPFLIVLRPAYLAAIKKLINILFRNYLVSLDHHLSHRGDA